MTHLVVDGVTARYGPTIALDTVGLEVDEGQIAAVIGPSGCGKSTLLRAIAGIEPLAEGRILLGGRDLAGVPTHRRDVGLMFQEHALFPHLSVADNVGFGLDMAGRSGRPRSGRDRSGRHQSGRERSDRVDELLGLVGLAGYGRRSIDALSGGEAQRVALARALAPSPGLLMLDEPLGSLDRVLREQLVVEVGAVIRSQGMTAVHVTHDQAEAFALADRVVVLRGGRVEQAGRPDELWRRPASAFVAEFLGHPNRWARHDRILVVPVTALAVTEGDGREAVIEAVTFREGRYRVVARSADTHPGEPIVFDTTEPLTPGRPVTVAVDASQVWEVPAED
jgi:thiamine transport system ATP-binding protein